MITRRSMLAAGAGLIAAPAIVGRAEAQAVQLRISTAANENDWLARAMNRFKEIVDRELPGQLAISVHPNSSLFRQGTELPALQRGNLECFTMQALEVEQQIPEFGVYGAGYTFRDWGHTSRTFAGPLGQEYFRAVAERMQIEILNIIYLGTRQLNLRQAREVRTPADLAGVRLRVPPGPGWLALARGLGTTPTPMAFPEVYLALKNGAIDGQENPLPITRVTNMHEVTQQIVMTSHMVQPVYMAFAKPFWDGCPTGPRRSCARRAGRRPNSTTPAGSATNRRWSRSSRARACASPRPISRPSAPRWRGRTSTAGSRRAGRRGSPTASPR